MTLYRLAGAIVFGLMLAVSAQAQTIMHGNDRPAGEATPANGSFSIRFPISYRYIEYKGVEASAGGAKDAPMAVQMLTGADGDGLRFSVTETPVRAPLPPIDSFLETAKNRPDAVVSDVRHEQKDDMEILSFALREPKQESFFRVLRSKTTGYVLFVQFPSELRSKATGMKDEFFGSFKVVRR